MSIRSIAPNIGLKGAENVKLFFGGTGRWLSYHGKNKGADRFIGNLITCVNSTHMIDLFDMYSNIIKDWDDVDALPYRISYDGLHAAMPIMATFIHQTKIKEAKERINDYTDGVELTEPQFRKLVNDYIDGVKSNKKIPAQNLLWVIAKHEQIKWQQVTSLEESDRGAGGFGSTGKK